MGHRITKSEKQQLEIEEPMTSLQIIQHFEVKRRRRLALGTYNIIGEKNFADPMYVS